MFFEFVLVPVDEAIVFKNVCTKLKILNVGLLIFQIHIICPIHSYMLIRYYCFIKRFTQIYLDVTLLRIDQDDETVSNLFKLRHLSLNDYYFLHL